MALYLAPVYFNLFSPHPCCSKGFSVFFGCIHLHQPTIDA